MESSRGKYEQERNPPPKAGDHSRFNGLANAENWEKLDMSLREEQPGARGKDQQPEAGNGQLNSADPSHSAPLISAPDL
jgi:hypothetical protein